MKKKRKTLVTAGAVEPYVHSYSLALTDQSRFTLPFQLMSYLLLSLIVFGFYGWLVNENNQIISVVIWLHAIFAPFYIPGVYHYYRFLRHEESKEVEIDERNKYIQYHNSRTGEKFLFHASQIVKCRYYRTILFPYNIDYVQLILKGGKEVYLSSLVVDPRELLADLDVRYSVEQKLFNSMPR